MRVISFSFTCLAEVEVMADDTFVTMAHNRIFVTTVASNPLVNNLIIGLPRLL
jgi:hypothetical protein